jgi:hypothetical protein
MKTQRKARPQLKPQRPDAVHEEISHLILDVEPPHSENEWNQMGFRVYVHKRNHIFTDRFHVDVH